jgi:DNA polymerase I-like protein with 3'-5' exonuclease and polymerase domains
MVVFDCPLKVEMERGQAFSAPSIGQGLLRPASLSGVKRSDMHFSYLASFYPPRGELKPAIFSKRSTAYEDFVFLESTRTLHVKKYLYTELLRLKQEICLVKPKVILVVGKWSLLFLTQVATYSETARSPFGTLLTWRGSHLKLTEWWENDSNIIVLPTLPTTAEWKLPEANRFKKHDYARLKMLVSNPVKEYDKQVEVCYQSSHAVKLLIELLQQLEKGKVWVSVDVETEFNAYIDCLSFCWKKDTSFVIPLAGDEPHYWTEDEEVKLTSLMIEVLLHPNCDIIGQNFTYDMQFFYRLWGINIFPAHDTMVVSHTLHPEAKKDLATLSSLYCEYHKYWKAEGKLHKGATRKERHIYNGKDTSITFEIASIQREVIKQSDIGTEQLDFQHKMLPVLSSMMNKGVKIDTLLREHLTVKVETLLVEIEKWFVKIGLECNLNSSVQLKEVFYTTLNAPAQFNRSTGAVSMDDTARKAIVEADILYLPFCEQLDVYKKYSTLLKTFLKAKLTNGRIHTEYKVSGTTTYRLSSTKNAFGTGANLQNLSKGKETLDGKTLPSIKSAYCPDEGNILAEADLQGADAKIIGYEAGSKLMMDCFRERKDLYSLLASEYEGRKVNKSEPIRQQFKAVAHACLTGAHEVLTPDGWVRLDKYNSEQELMVWNPANGDMNFEVPKGFYKSTLNIGDSLVRLTGTFFNQLMTPDHKLPISFNMNPTVVLTPVNRIINSANLPITGNYIFPIVPSGIDLKVLALAFHRVARKSIVQKFDYEVKVKKILHGSKIKFKHCRSTIAWDLPQDLVDVKIGDWVFDLMRSEAHTLVRLIEDLSTSSSRSCVVTKRPERAKLLQLLYFLLGFRSKIGKDARGFYSVGKAQQYHVVKKNLAEQYITLDRHTNIYCPSTSTGAFVVQHEGLIQITGNTHYLGKAPTIAANTGLLVHEVEKVQKWYLSANPELLRWHKKVKGWVDGRGWLQNYFGYRYYFLDRSRKTRYNQATAYLAQSCIAVLINKILYKIATETPDWLQPLLQVHDSVVMQYPKEKKEEAEKLIREKFDYPLKYEVGTLTIGVDIATSERNWKEVKEI